MGPESVIGKTKEHRGPRPLLGVSLVVVGNLIPWACYRGFSTGCESGLEWRYPNFPLSLTVVIVLAALILMAVFLLHRTGLALDRVLWTELVLLTSLCMILYTPFIFPPTRFYHLVQPLIVVSSALLLWLILFPFVRSAVWKRGGTTAR